MTENEYLIATNRVKVSAARTILFDVLPGGDYGITDDELASLLKPLCRIEKRLFDLTKIKD
jgi:hypothetical protein